MRFLYGDSTPFPLETNFIETLKAVVEAASALLKVDQLLERGRESRAAAQAEVERETTRLDQMTIALERGLEGQLAGSEAPHAGMIASRVLKAARAVVEAGRAEITERREQTVRDLETQTSEWRNGITRALDHFFAGQDLIGSTWRLRWRGGLAEEPAQLIARVTTVFALDVLLNVELPGAHLFSRAFKLADLEKGVQLRLPTASGWIRKGTELKATPVDGYLVTEVTCSPEKKSFVLHRPGRPPGTGIEVVVRAEGQSRALLRILGEKAEDAGDPVGLEGLEVSVAQRVMAKLEDSLKELARGRRRLEKAVYEGVPVRDHDRPAQIATRFLGTAAPLTREMRRRAATTQELNLKHELGGGRREEIYVERKELISRYADLDQKRRAYFDVLALEQDDITETAVTAQIVVGELFSSEGEGAAADPVAKTAPKGPPPPPTPLRNGSVRRKTNEPRPLPLAAAIAELSTSRN